MKTYLTELITTTLKTLDFPITEIQLERPKNRDHGDFSSNYAMVSAKQMKTSPKMIAERIISALPASPHIEKVILAGNGFINFYLSRTAQQQIILDILQEQEQFGRNTLGNNQKVQIEFVSANPTGPLHVGHGRGAAIGDSIARILQMNGWQVTREFYYNDAGMQIENLTKSVQARAKNQTPEHPDWPKDGYQGEYIKEIAQDYNTKKPLQFEDEIITPSADLNDVETMQRYAVAFLRKEQNRDLASFDVQFDVFTLESYFYQNGKIEETINILKNNGYTYEQDSALWLKTSQFGDDKDRVMQKSDGSYTYFVPDISYHIDKWERGFKRVINEQGADHHSTITRVRAGLQAMHIGIPQNWPEYVLHQMVTVMQNGEEVKISKRAGGYVTLRDLIELVGVSATRYFLISRRTDSQLIFDIDLARSQNNDNPVYYIQYAHARISSLIKQAPTPPTNTDLSLLNEDDIAELLQTLAEFPDIVITAGQELSPHLIAHYLQKLAGLIHKYYNDYKILSAESPLKNARIMLMLACQQVLKNGLSLIGVSAPDSM